jgi:hypothetical protein
MARRPEKKKPQREGRVPVGGSIKNLTKGEPAGQAAVPKLELDEKTAKRAMASERGRAQIIESHNTHGHQPGGGLVIKRMNMSKNPAYEMTHTSKGWIRTKKRTIIVDDSGRIIA